MILKRCWVLNLLIRWKQRRSMPLYCSSYWSGRMSSWPTSDSIIMNKDLTFKLSIGLTLCVHAWFLPKWYQNSHSQGNIFSLYLQSDLDKSRWNYWGGVKKRCARQNETSLLKNDKVSYWRLMSWLESL